MGNNNLPFGNQPHTLIFSAINGRDQSLYMIGWWIELCKIISIVLYKISWGHNFVNKQIFQLFWVPHTITTLIRASFGIHCNVNWVHELISENSRLWDKRKNLLYVLIGKPRWLFTNSSGCFSVKSSLMIRKLDLKVRIL